MPDTQRALHRGLGRLKCVQVVVQETSSPYQITSLGECNVRERSVNLLQVVAAPFAHRSNSPAAATPSPPTARPSGQTPAPASGPACPSDSPASRNSRLRWIKAMWAWRSLCAMTSIGCWIRLAAPAPCGGGATHPGPGLGRRRGMHGEYSTERARSEWSRDGEDSLATQVKPIHAPSAPAAHARGPTRRAVLPRWAAPVCTCWQRGARSRAARSNAPPRRLSARRG